VVLDGAVLPATPAAAALGFVPLPASYFLFLVAATIAYLALVEVTKAAIMKRVALRSPGTAPSAVGSICPPSFVRAPVAERTSPPGPGAGG
jgi:hypothetical protein